MQSSKGAIRPPTAPREPRSRSRPPWQIAGIEGKASIKYLELWQLRDLRTIDIVEVLPGLQNLFLQSLPHIGSFPKLTDATALRRIVVHNLQGLVDLTALQTAPALVEFALVDGRKQTPEHLLPVLRNPSVLRVSAGFGSDCRNREFLRLRDEHGKTELTGWGTFGYR